MFKRALDWVEAWGWLTLTLELFLVAEDDVVDVGVWVGITPAGAASIRVQCGIIISLPHR